MRPNLKGVLPVAEMRGESQEETRELKDMLACARSFVEGHEWCGGIRECHYGFGIGGVVAVFLFAVDVREVGLEWLWIIEGDLPSAYLVTDSASDASEALEVYASLMQDWVEAVRAGSGLDGVFPVQAPVNEEHARMLEKRIRFLRDKIIPISRGDA